jgi:ABC-type transport system substrate-binding protein
LPDNAADDKVATSLYTIEIQPGILYAPHPAFAKDAQGAPAYLNLSEAESKNFFKPSDFPLAGTRELLAEDFVYEIKRLAHPRIVSPIFGHMAEYIEGLKALGDQLKADDALLKKERKAKGLSTASADLPWLDLRKVDVSGVKVLDSHRYQIRIKGKYPQFVYWLAMPFFAPIAWEADAFYSQPGFAAKNLTLDWWPVGTGPYMLTENDPNSRMVLTRNPNYRGEKYPSEGEEGDAAAGLLKDAGKPIPFIDRVVFTREKEGIPYWNKFLQGYYDSSGVSSDTFDQVIRASVDGAAGLTADMSDKGIKLETSLATSLYYLGFNWLDPVVGPGSDENSAKRSRLLRQAIAIAVDWEEFSQIFTNGRAVPAQGPLVPGIFGFPEGLDGVNRYVYDIVDGKPKRKSIEQAKALLAQAGYPEGRDVAKGQPLVLSLDTTGNGPGDKARFDWYRKQLAKLDIQLDIRATDWNRFQEKVRKGNTQLFFLGWNADYPDPENFLFLLHGPKSRAKTDGENASNYANPEYDKLFDAMKGMGNGPERQAIIAKMIAMVQQDAPWLFAFHPRNFSLNHAWLGNVKPNDLARNDIKYKHIDSALRAKGRAAWNAPVVWPFALMAVLMALAFVPAWLAWRRRDQAGGLRIDLNEAMR